MLGQIRFNIFAMRRAFDKQFLLLIICIALSGICMAQDPTISNYNHNQYYYNPAYTGYQGGYQIAATYRTQWPNVPGKIFPGPLSTSYGFFNAGISKGEYYIAGAGAFGMQDVEGQGFLTTSTGGLSYAQHFPIRIYKADDLPRLEISIGFKGYINSISVNWNKLIFGDQLSIDNGINGSSAFDHTGIESILTGDMDAGLLLQNNFMGKKDWHNELGFAMDHIVSPATSLLRSTEATTRIPRKFIASYRSTVRLQNGHFFIGPTVLFENQSNFYDLNTGVEFFYKNNPRSAGIPFSISFGHRFSITQDQKNTNAIIVSVTHKGVIGKTNPTIYYAGFSVDCPYAGLGLQTNGAYELSIGVVIPSKGNNRFSECPYSSFDHSSEMMNWIKE